MNDREEYKQTYDLPILKSISLPGQISASIIVKITCFVDICMNNVL